MPIEMTPRQRWLAILSGKSPDRIPTDYRGTAEVTERLKRDLNCPDEEALWARLHVDYITWAPAKWKHETNPRDPEADRWGVRYTSIDYGTGSYREASYHPLEKLETVAQLEEYPWPDPDEWDYSEVTRQVEADNGLRPMLAGYYEPFLLYCYMRGLERAFEDLICEPEFAEYALRRIFEFHYEHNRRTCEAAKGRFDFFYLAEDLGSQAGPLMSLELYRKFLRENQKRMADMIKGFGIHIFYHTDGAARTFLPDLVDYVGIEVLNPVQWRCPGMEREGLVKDFGHKLSFHGAMDNQHTMPFGTVAEVKQEVRDNLRILGSSPRGWFCAPCHNLQPVTPTENIVAMYETIREIGKLN